MRTPDTFIKGLGVFLPATVSVASAVQQGRYPAFDAEVHELEGAAVAGDTPAPDMALRAAREAYARCGHRPDDTDLLLYADSWYQGPDGWQPQYHLQRHLVGDEVLAVEVRQGCNGMFAALDLAAGYLRSRATTGDPGRAPTALLVAADNFGTPMMDRWTMGPGYIAGDGASAVLLTTEPSFARLAAVGSVTVSAGEQMHRGTEPLFPPGPTLGRALDFQARNREAKAAAAESGTGLDALVKVHGMTLALVERTLKDAGITLADVTRVAYMNYSREIVEQRCMAALGLPMEKSTWDFGRTVGHLGASDQIVSLDRLLADDELRPGDHFLMLGVGPGITLSCAVVQILHEAPWRG